MYKNMQNDVELFKTNYMCNRKMTEEFFQILLY